MRGCTAGAIGGFLAWLVTEALLGGALDVGARGIHLYVLDAAYGVLIGVLIGACLGIAEGITMRMPLRFATNMLVGAWLGALGGAIGVPMAELLYRLLRGAGMVSIIARPVGWGVLGAVLGSAQGVARQSLRGAVHALIGGAIGGIIGGVAFDALHALLATSASSAFPRGIALLITGALIGIFALLFERFLARGMLKIVSGKLEGREFVLDKPQLIIGRDERCDIPIYYDREVAPQHAILEWTGNGYKLTPVGQNAILHKGRRVNEMQLAHNDIITVGNTKLIFRTATAVDSTPLAAPDVLQCPNCKQTNRPTAKFCRQCGRKLPRHAPSLGLAFRWLANAGLALAILAVLFGAVQFLSTHAFARVQPAQRFYGAGVVARLAVTPKGYDDIGAVLKKLGRGYEFQKISFDTLYNLDALRRFDVVFINCSRECLRADERLLRKTLREYVANGGTIYASDWAAGMIKVAFDEYVQFAEDRGDRQTLTAHVRDEALAEIIGETISLQFNADQWIPIEYVAPSVKVYLTGDYRSMSGRTYRDRPLLISFRHGKGFVIYTCFHNEPQLSEAEKKLLRFLVVRPVTFELSARADTLLAAKRSAPMREIVGTISAGHTSPPYVFTLREPNAITIALYWRGGDGDFELRIASQDGTWKRSKRGRESPLTLDLPNMRAGSYSIRVTAHRVPYPNTPYVLRIGVKR